MADRRPHRAQNLQQQCPRADDRAGNKLRIRIGPVAPVPDSASLRDFMGSLIKKRRKRMRKKKHRKLLKRTRVQRRNKK